VKILQSDWLSSPLGESLLAQERALVSEVWQRVFGDHLLQIGSWGAPGYFLDGVRTRNCGIVDVEPAAGLAAVVSPGRLGIATDCIDAVFLPHTLELSPAPHAVLREVHRILRPDGKLVILGFNPFSWWGLWHQFASRGYPPGLLRHISRGRITDWMSLLNLRIDRIAQIESAPLSSSRNRWRSRLPGSRPAYIVVAKKETMPLSHVRPRLRRRARLVSGLVNPTTRNAA
jgi:SAM-dependent methyltransferase